MTQDILVYTNQHDEGPLELGLRPNFFQHSFGGVLTDYDGLLPIFARGGLIRDSVGWWTGEAGDTSPQDAQKGYDALRNLFLTNDTRFSQPLRAGVRMLISLWTAVPVYLRQTLPPPSESSLTGKFNSPPNDFALAREHFKEIARIFKWAAETYGFKKSQCIFTLLNEPDTGPSGLAVGFNGSVESMIRVYALMALSVKAIDPELRVGGCEFANFLSRTTAMTPNSETEGYTTELFIRGCGNPQQFNLPDLPPGATRLPLDAITIHDFFDQHHLLCKYKIRSWLREAQYNPDHVEVFVSESNFGIGTGGGLWGTRCGALGAAHWIARSMVLPENGIDGQCYALIRAGTIAAPGGYSGDEGLYLQATAAPGSPLVPSAIERAMRMLALLGKRKIKRDLSVDAVQKGILCVATTGDESRSSTRWVLVCRFSLRNSSGWPANLAPGDSVPLFEQELARLDLPAAIGVNFFSFQYHTGMTATDVNNYIGGSYSLRAGHPLATQLAAIKTSILNYRATMNSNLTATISFVDAQKISLVRRYDIASGVTNNPYAAWNTEFAIASNFNNAVTQALAQGGPTLTASTTYNNAQAVAGISWTLEPQQVSLFEVVSSSLPNLLPAIEPKPIERYSFSG